MAVAMVIVLGGRSEMLMGAVVAASSEMLIVFGGLSEGFLMVLIGVSFRFR